MIFPSIVEEMLELNGIAVHEKKETSRPGFIDIYEANLERRRVEQLRAAARREKSEEDKKASDFSKQKLYLSLLHRLGGHAPIVPAGDPDAATVLLQALQACRCGARRPFSRDSDRDSMPQFPVVRFKQI